MTASSAASQGRSRASTWTPRSRVGDPDVHVAGAGAGLGHHGTRTGGPAPGNGAGVLRRPARACGTARPRRPPGGSPAAPRRPRPAAGAGSARGRGSSRPVHTPVAVSTWNRISSCCIPGSPPSIRTSSGPASTAAPVDGSSSTNSSSTPSVIAPAARTAPGAPPGTVAARPAPPGPGITTTCWSGSGRSGRRWPSALARPATAWAAGISGHSRAASVREAATCTATTSAPASVTTCPAAVQVASGGCPAGIGRVRVIAWSFLSLPGAPAAAGTRPAMTARGWAAADLAARAGTGTEAVTR